MSSAKTTQGFYWGGKSVYQPLRIRSPSCCGPCPAQHFQHNIRRKAVGWKVRLHALHWRFGGITCATLTAVLGSLQPHGQSASIFRLTPALLHGPAQIADLPVPVGESPGAVSIGHAERGHLVEYLTPNSVFNSLPRQRSSPHLGPHDRLVTIDRVLHPCFARCSLRACTIHVGRVFRLYEYGGRVPAWRCSNF